MLKHEKPSPRVHVSPFACVRCNLKLRFWTYIRGKPPVPVKPGRIVPSPCEAPWFYIIIRPKQTQNKRVLLLATPVRGTSRGVDDPMPTDQGFTGDHAPGRRNTSRTCMWP